jgi:hypothetical protein
LRAQRNVTAGFVAGCGERKASRERIVCNKSKAIGASHCNAILINAGTDLLQFVNTPRRALADAKSSGSESSYMLVLFSTTLDRCLATVRMISHLVADLTERRASDRPMAR